MHLSFAVCTTNDTGAHIELCQQSVPKMNYTPQHNKRPTKKMHSQNMSQTVAAVSIYIKPFTQQKIESLISDSNKFIETEGA